jgi:hypothetical protein
MLNARLAMDYRIAGVEGDGFRRVTLRPEDNRGGLLTQAAILSLTSDGTRHRPVHRGVWVSESILGRTPPPPPANVDPIEPNPVDAPKATLRMKLAAHKAHAQCASCHRKIDPLGLAFENFDAIGRWRTVESVPLGKGADPPVDASGELPDGRRFADARGFKRLPPDEPDASARPFVGGGGGRPGSRVKGASRPDEPEAAARPFVGSGVAAGWGKSSPGPCAPGTNPVAVCGPPPPHPEKKRK